LGGIAGVGFLSPWRDFGNWFWRERPPDASFIGLFGLAMIASLWAYDGWTYATAMAEEMRDPQRNVPRSLIVGTLVVIAIYLSVNLAYHALLPLAQIQATKTVAAEAVSQALGSMGARAIAVAAMVSTFGAVNGVLITGPRIFYAMARDRLFFRPMGLLHRRYQTPHGAILAQGLWATALI